MPMWEILHGFIIGTSNSQSVQLTGSDVDAAIGSRLTAPLRFYNGATHDLITHVPDAYARYLTREHEVLQCFMRNGMHTLRSSDVKVMDRAVGSKKPLSMPTDWKTCSCDKRSCVELDGPSGIGGSDAEEDDAENEDEVENEEL